MIVFASASWVANRRPDLQFRSEQVYAKAASGQTEEAREDLHAWLAAAPGQEQAWLLAASFQLAAGVPCARTLRELSRLQGGDADITLSLIDMELAQFHPDSALALAAVAEVPTVYYAVHKRVRLGNAWLMKGQFRRARDHLMAAQELLGGGGVEFRGRILRDLTTLSEALGDQVAAATWRTAMLEDSQQAGDGPDLSAGIRYLAQAAQHRCPPTEGSLVGVPSDSKPDAKRFIERLALRAGCGDCARVLALDGFDYEGNYDTVTVLASCLEGAGRTTAGLKVLEPHLRYLEQSLVAVPSVSVPEVMRAQYWHGRLLQQSGDLAGARADYARFVELWGEADAPIPEMPDSRARLKALSP